EIRVIDSGEGISPEIYRKIFQPFFTTKEIGKGTGMGLSISLGIAEAHHGRLYIDESSPNTCFVLELPQRQANAHPKAR
ncbi:MAG: HAMP domain-containing histidine kinase, partial [Proteobacteria bacterium]